MKALFRLPLRLLLALCLSAPLAAAPAGRIFLLDFPECGDLPAPSGQVTLGLASPSANPGLAFRLFELGQSYQDLALCQVSWNSLLPDRLPWAKQPALERYYGWGVFALALLPGLMLFSLLPAAWRRHLTLLGLLFIGGVTWSLGAAGLHLLNASGLSRLWFYDEVIYLQKGGDEPLWLEVASVEDLDRQLARLGLRPDRQPPGPRTQPARKDRPLMTQAQLGGEAMTVRVPAGAELERRADKVPDAAAREEVFQE